MFNVRVNFTSIEECRFLRSIQIVYRSFARMRDRIRRAIRAPSLFFVESLLIAPRNAFKLVTRRALIFLILVGLGRYWISEAESVQTINTSVLLTQRLITQRLNCPLKTVYVLRCCGVAVVLGFSEISQRLV